MIKINQLILFTTAVVFSCVGKPEEKSVTLNTLSKGNEVDQNKSVSTETSEKRRNERKRKGDTLAMSFNDLKKYLPEEINGYVAQGNAQGEYMDIPGMSFSQAEQVYKKGNSILSISLFDYNCAYDMYAGASALFSESAVENNEEIAKTVVLDNDLKGWESYKIKERKSELSLGIAERFYLSIKADKQEGTEFIKSAAVKLDLKALKSL